MVKTGDGDKRFPRQMVESKNPLPKEIEILNNIKQYVDVKFLGSGWFGKVYSGYDTRTNKMVAIKEIEDLIKANHEIEVMRNISSSYFPTFYESFYKNNKGYIVMEYIEGKPLGGPMYEGGEKRTEKQSVQIIINALKGLRDLHNVRICS